MTIEEAQEECKRRFPIGCQYRRVENNKLFTLINDKSTYSITNSTIWAHRGAGLLYDRVNETFATLISLPKVILNLNNLNLKKMILNHLLNYLKK